MIRNKKVIPYNTSTCNICYKNNNIPKIVKICSNCKLVSYCGKEHQSQEWKQHKQFCTAISYFLKKLNLNYIFDLNGGIINSSRNDYDSARHSVKKLLEEYLGRNLHAFELSIINFPKVCKICYEYNHNIIFPCNKCKAVFYCSTEHQVQHERNHKHYCDSFKFHNLYRRDASPVYWNHEITDIIHKANDEIENFPSSLFQLFFELTGKLLTCTPSKIADYPIFNTFCDYSFITTILYSLNLTQNHLITTNENFIIDIVGAEFETIFFENKVLKIIYNFPIQKLLHKNIIINFIGPKLFIPISSYSITNKQTTVTVNTFQDKYENFRNKSCRYSPPNFIISFNCGFHELMLLDNRNPWYLGLKQISKYNNVPIVFTSYTKNEGKLDLEMLEKVCSTNNFNFDILLETKKNPFCDFRPIKNAEEMDDDEIFFINGYITIICIFFSLPGSQHEDW